MGASCAQGLCVVLTLYLVVLIGIRVPISRLLDVDDDLPEEEALGERRGAGVVVAAMCGCRHRTAVPALSEASSSNATSPWARVSTSCPSSATPACASATAPPSDRGRRAWRMASR